MSFDDVPKDFPQSSFPIGALSAQHPFDATLSWRGYVAWVTTEERYDRWAFCEALAKQLLPFAQHEAERHPSQSAEGVLGRVWVAVARKGWVSLAELDWLVQRMKTLLQW
uniref:Uncharacterized protein n=1 Tax=Ralstonia solanacearum TaxID=305 RepID=A0A0S4UV61_RALSL|nr:conserved protein of unknown function [Ralstonia solanacearum]CUV28138.1 conserved protein of unknown function [Ralstonia solanacearum]CUV35045.1 conserved protein of unknown function [Ralstonia solanacearum]CUV38487.1 conserved protein of unknown function [Ralstonia solanacearum]CUV59124.1 conserved protein of unknown function [Ralstonia solanacearum]